MPENASSSQNANSAENRHLIASLEPTGKGGFFFINFPNREPLKILKSIVRDSGIYEGQIISESRILELLLENEAEMARRAGMDMLARRPHSQKELRDKLARKGFDKPAILRASGRFLELGLLDDLEFSKSWIRSRISSGKSSRNEIFSKLIAKGVSRNTARQALDELLPLDEEVALCKKLLESMLSRGRITPEKAQARLSRRGFPWPVIKRALER